MDNPGADKHRDTKSCDLKMRVREEIEIHAHSCIHMSSIYPEGVLPREGHHNITCVVSDNMAEDKKPAHVQYAFRI